METVDNFLKLFLTTCRYTQAGGFKNGETRFDENWSHMYRTTITTQIMMPNKDLVENYRSQNKDSTTSFFSCAKI